MNYKKSLKCTVFYFYPGLFKIGGIGKFGWNNPLRWLNKRKTTDRHRLNRRCASSRSATLTSAAAFGTRCWNCGCRQRNWSSAAASSRRCALAASVVRRTGAPSGDFSRSPSNSCWRCCPTARSINSSPVALNPSSAPIQVIVVLLPQVLLQACAKYCSIPLGPSQTRDFYARRALLVNRNEKLVEVSSFERTPNYPSVIRVTLPPWRNCRSLAHRMGIKLTNSNAAKLANKKIWAKDSIPNGYLCFICCPYGSFPHVDNEWRMLCNW